MIPRVLAMLSLIPAAPDAIGVSALRTKLGELGHGTTTRTLQRDLVSLSEHLPIESRAMSKPFGWFWAEGSKCPCCGGERKASR